MRILTRNEIEKLAQVIRERCKEAIVAPTVTVRGGVARTAPTSTFSIAPSMNNPMGIKQPAPSLDTEKTTKDGLTTGGTGAKA